MERNTALGAIGALVIAGLCVVAALVLRSTETPQDTEAVAAVVMEDPASVPAGVSTSTATPASSSIATLPTTTSQNVSGTPTTSQSTSTSANPQPTSTTNSVVAITEAQPDPGEPPSSNLHTIAVRFESRVDDVSATELGSFAIGVLADPKGWIKAGVAFVSQADAPHLIVIAEPAEVDQLCLPLGTKSQYSCQQGPVVAINADAALPDRGGRAAVMEQQTISLDGCAGNSWPLDWEIQWASRSPLTIAPPSSWNGPAPTNQGDQP